MDLLSSKRCDACNAIAYQGPPTNVITTCQPCPQVGQKYNLQSDPYKCECDEPNGWVASNDESSQCFLKTELDQADLPDYSDGVIYYNQIMQDNEVLQVYPFYSQTMRDLYIGAAMGCQVDRNEKSCQQLANLCVLNMYAERSPVCVLLRELTA